jgi:hypothetical protein
MWLGKCSGSYRAATCQHEIKSDKERRFSPIAQGFAPLQTARNCATRLECRAGIHADHRRIGLNQIVPNQSDVERAKVYLLDLSH